MKIYPREPDLVTVYRRIKEGELDLQPDFQRDLVWNKAKKQGLIDTILREWQFPPVFVVVPASGVYLDVLDGQQRLNAIYEFFEGNFEVDGYIAPHDNNIKALDGLRFDDLPHSVKTRFERYSVRFYELSDYNQDEPYELFFRLNQGSALTPAEKRNTFYGPVRDQVRALVEHMQAHDLNVNRIGFNNNRLSYHDVMSRLLFALNTKYIGKKITDASLVDFFRSGEPVDSSVMAHAKNAIDLLSLAIGRKVKLNKPTLLTWLIFFSHESNSESTRLLLRFEEVREETKSKHESDTLISLFCDIYQERSASSVNDAIPVQLRLLTIYLVGLCLDVNFDSRMGKLAQKILDQFKLESRYSEERLIALMIEAEWSYQ